MSLFSWTSLPPPPSSHPSRLFQSPGMNSLNHTANSHWLSILRMVVHMLPCYCLHSSHPLLSPYCPLPTPPRVRKSVLYVCVSCAALKIEVHHYHLSRFHIYGLIYDTGFSFSDLLHSENRLNSAQKTNPPCLWFNRRKCQLQIAKGICHLSLRRLNPVLLQLLPLTCPEGSPVWRWGTLLQGNWWNRSLDSLVFSGTDPNPCISSHLEKY